MKCIFLTLLFTFVIVGSNAQKANSPKAANNDTVVYEQNQLKNPPRFPGGTKAFYKFLSANVKWPDQIDGQGRVVVDFIVEKDGRLTNIKISKGSVPEFNAEALRVIRKFPKWVPGMINGRPVRVKYSVPINFTLGYSE